MAIKSFITLFKWKVGAKKAVGVIFTLNSHSWQAAGFQMGFLSQMPKALIHCCGSASVNYSFCKHCLLAWYTQPLRVLCTAHCINLWNGKTQGESVTYVKAIAARMALTKLPTPDKPWFLTLSRWKQGLPNEEASSSKIKPLHPHLGKNNLPLKTIFQIQRESNTSPACQHNQLRVAELQWFTLKFPLLHWTAFYNYFWN